MHPLRRIRSFFAKFTPRGRQRKRKGKSTVATEMAGENSKGKGKAEVDNNSASVVQINPSGESPSWKHEDRKRYTQRNRGGFGSKVKYSATNIQQSRLPGTVHGGQTETVL